MNYKNVLAIGSLIAGAALASPSFSQVRPYLGASLGSSDTRKFCTDQPNCDKTGSAWRAFAGTRFTPSIGAEAGYVDLGRASFGDAGSTTRLERAGGDLLAVLAYPSGRASLFAKAGGYYIKSRAKLETPISTTTVEKSNGGLTYGLGVQYDFKTHFGVRADWQRYAKVGGGDTGDAKDVDAWLIGLVVNFR